MASAIATSPFPESLGAIEAPAIRRNEGARAPHRETRDRCNDVQGSALKRGSRSLNSPKTKAREPASGRQPPIEN